MTKEKESPTFLTESSIVIDLHDESIQEFGGLAGIRDIGLLESALSHPEMLHYYGEPSEKTLEAFAASYFFHIIKNHPFVDGNKRAALSATLYFLKLNKYRLNVSYDALYELAIDTAASKINKDTIAAFFLKHLQAI